MIVAHDLRPPPRAEDEIFVLRDAPWALYERLLDLRGERGRPKMAYLDGTLELMTTSPDHECIKKTLARLFEAWCDEVGIDVEGYGEVTCRNRRKKGGVEPDECHVRGDPRRGERPGPRD